METQRDPRRWTVGDVVPTRTLTTINDRQVPLPDPDGLTHLQFRRFAACPLCNVHLRSLTRRHDEIVAAGIREVVVFHSTAAHMRPHQGSLPFAAVADPGRELYDEFGVTSSPRAVLHPAAWTGPFRLETWRTVAREWQDHTATPFRVRTDSMTGLPAEFLIDSRGVVRAVKYGRHAADQWGVDDLLRSAGAASASARDASAPERG